MHIAFAQVWRGSRFTDDEALWPALEAGGRTMLARQFDELEQQCGEDWLILGRFTAADTYALTFLRWAKRLEFEPSDYPRWLALAGRVLDRPAVHRALTREGLTAEGFLTP